VDSDHSVDADGSKWCKYGAKPELSSCAPLASIDGWSVGFSTRRDDPSNSGLQMRLRRPAPFRAIPIKSNKKLREIAESAVLGTPTGRAVAGRSRCVQAQFRMSAARGGAPINAGRSARKVALADIVFQLESDMGSARLRKLVVLVRRDMEVAVTPRRIVRVR
jgi:hypothetical protein